MSSNTMRLLCLWRDRSWFACLMNQKFDGSELNLLPAMLGVTMLRAEKKTAALASVTTIRVKFISDNDRYDNAPRLNKSTAALAHLCYPPQIWPGSWLNHFVDLQCNIRVCCDFRLAATTRKSKPTVGLMTRTALSENIVKFGQPPVNCLSTTRYEHNVALFVWRRQPGNQ